MAHLTFDIYRINKDNAVLDETMEFDTETTDAVEQNRVTEAVRELNKDNKVLVSPNNELAAWVLGKPSRRGRKATVSPEVVRFIHEQHVNEEVPIANIPMRIFAKFEGLELSNNIVKAVLNQERDTDVDGIDDLREAATALKNNRKGNRKHSDETKAEWVRLYEEENMSGSAIAKRYELNSATVNAHLKKVGVQRNGRGRPKSEQAEQVA